MDGDATTFAWDWATPAAGSGQAPVPELLRQGKTRYLVGHDTLGWHDGNTWAYSLPDALGSVRQAVDGAGAVVRAREWTPFGVALALSGAEGAGESTAGLGYTGEWWDADVGLEYLRARWYQPGTGRFTSRDPWEGTYNRPQSLNGWVYVEGNPIRLVDPSGYSWDAETQINVSILKKYFLQSAARHNAIPTMDQNGFAALIASTMANENRMGNMPKDDPNRNPRMQTLEDMVMGLGCIVSGHELEAVCRPINNDDFDAGKCLDYLSNHVPEGEPLFTLASVGIGNIKLATAARIWKGLNGCNSTECPPVTVSPLQYPLDVLPGLDFTLDIANPFETSCDTGTCDYDPATNAAAYGALGKQLLDSQKNIEYAAALLEEGALMTLNAGEQPSAFASVTWYKLSAATWKEIKKVGDYAAVGSYVLVDMDQALSLWDLNTTWDRHSWKIEPQYNLWLIQRTAQETQNGQ